MTGINILYDKQNKRRNKGTIVLKTVGWYLKDDILFLDYKDAVTAKDTHSTYGYIYSI